MAVTTAFTGNAGTANLGALVLELTSWTVTQDTNMVDLTAVGDTWQEQKPGTRNWTASVTCFAVAAGTNGGFVGDTGLFIFETTTGFALTTGAAMGYVKGGTLTLDFDGSVVWVLDVVGLSGPISWA